MTPSQVAALLVGASVNDGTGALATVTLTRPLYKLPGDEDGLIELRWTTGPHTNRISVFDYADPCFQKFTPGVSSFTDTPFWDSWANSPSSIGATALNVVTSPDVLYVSYGAGWVNIVWTTVKAGDRIQVKSADGTILYQDWTTSAAFIPQAPGGHVAVLGGAPSLCQSPHAVVTVILLPS